MIGIIEALTPALCVLVGGLITWLAHSTKSRTEARRTNLLALTESYLKMETAIGQYRLEFMRFRELEAELAPSCNPNDEPVFDYRNLFSLQEAIRRVSLLERDRKRQMLVKKLENVLIPDSLLPPEPEKGHWPATPYLFHPAYIKDLEEALGKAHRTYLDATQSLTRSLWA